MSEVFEILLPLFAGLAAFVLVMRGVLALVRRKLRAEVRRKFPGSMVLRESYGANFFGLASLGMGQVRGNGALVLTAEQLYFRLFAPKRELNVPLRDVTAVSTPRSHLGKTVGARLLKVEFRGPGGDDAAAWAVSDVDGWKDHIVRYSPYGVDKEN